MPRPHIEPYVELNDDWKKMTLKTMPQGMLYKMLSFDTDSGACSMKVRFESGAKMKPSFSHSEIELFILKGKLKLGDATYGEGQYFFIPAGVALPELTASTGCEALLYFNSCEPNFVESDADHPSADRAGFSTVNAYADMPWAVSKRSPSVATGCMTKSLHVDQRSLACTFLDFMTPEFW